MKTNSFLTPTPRLLLCSPMMPLPRLNRFCMRMKVRHLPNRELAADRWSSKSRRKRREKKKPPSCKRRPTRAPQRWQKSKPKLWLSRWLWMLLKLPKKETICNLLLQRLKSMLSLKVKSKLKSHLNNKLSQKPLPFNTIPLPSLLVARRTSASLIWRPKREKLKFKPKLRHSMLPFSQQPLLKKNRLLSNLKRKFLHLTLLPLRLAMPKLLNLTQLCRLQELPQKSKPSSKLKNAQCFNPLAQALRPKIKCSSSLIWIHSIPLWSRLNPRTKRKQFSTFKSRLLSKPRRSACPRLLPPNRSRQKFWLSTPLLR